MTPPSAPGVRRLQRVVTLPVPSRAMRAALSILNDGGAWQNHGHQIPVQPSGAMGPRLTRNCEDNVTTPVGLEVRKHEAKRGYYRALTL